MRVTSGSKRGRDSRSSHLIELNNQRLQTAGKPGSKKFMDPNKVFIGNLPYDATEADVSALFADHYNMPLEAVGDKLESIKIIRDWRSGKSKGYGFLQFYEPMAATSAMESINKGTGKGWRIKGRRIRLDQGQRTPNADDERAKKKKQKEKESKKEKERRELDEEGRVIHAVLEGVEGADAVAEEDEGLMSEDDMITFMEKGGLRGVMPLTEENAGFLGLKGLYDDGEEEGYDEIDDLEEYYNENGYRDGDFDAALDVAGGEEGEEQELVYDGVFEEEYNPNEYEGLSKEEEEKLQVMNREQRRAAEKNRKKRKLPFKGFGSAS